MASKYSMIFGYSSNRSGSNPLPPRSAGLSESYYDTLNENKAGAFDDLCNKRAQLLPVGCAIIGQKFQLVDPNGPATTIARLFPGPSLTTNSADIPQMGLRVSLVGADGFNNITKILRLLPDSQVVEGEFQPSTAFANALASFATQLVSGQWHFKATDKGNPNIPLLSVAANGACVSVIPHGLAVNDKVIITRGKNSRGKVVKVVGLVISATTATTFSVYPGPQVDLTGGFARKKQTVYPLVSRVTQGRVTTRKVGRPSDAYRGRASARR